MHSGDSGVALAHSGRSTVGRGRVTDKRFHDSIFERVKRDHASRPPGRNRAMAASRPARNAPSSSFTAIRNAWKTRVAGMTWATFGITPSTTRAKPWYP